MGNGALPRPRASGQSFCTITTNPNGIFFTKSGIEYYFVEISCKDDIQYKIQAFGDEALELYKEVQRYISSKRERKQSNSGRKYLTSDNTPQAFRLYSNIES